MSLFEVVYHEVFTVGHLDLIQQTSLIRHSCIVLILVHLDLRMAFFLQDVVVCYVCVVLDARGFFDVTLNLCLQFCDLLSCLQVLVSFLIFVTLLGYFHLLVNGGR